MLRYPSCNSPLHVKHPYTFTLLYYLKKNNSMRDMHAPNLLCNLRLFDVEHQGSGIFVHVWHMYGKCTLVPSYVAPLYSRQ